MNCPIGCPPFSVTRCRPCPRKSQGDSSSTFGTEPVPTTWPTGSIAQGIPSPLQPSSDTEPAFRSQADATLACLSLALGAMEKMDDSREKSIARTKVEEAVMWIEKIVE